MIKSLDGRIMKQVGDKKHWESFNKFKDEYPDSFQEIHELALEHISKNQEVMVSNWWAKNILDLKKYKVTASLLGCIFWWTLSNLDETYISFQDSRDLADGNAAPLRKFFLEKQNKKEIEKEDRNTGQANYTPAEMNELFRDELMQTLEYEAPLPFHKIAGTELGQDIWDFLKEPNKLDLAEQAVENHWPVAENLSGSLLKRFGGEVMSDQTKQMIGSMVKQIMSQMGYSLEELAIRCNKGNLFSMGATYTR